MFLADLLEASIEQGAFTDAESELERRGFAGELPFQHLGTVFLLCARARLRASTGNPRGALDDLDVCATGLASLGAVNPAMIPWRGYAARARLAVGDRDGARSLADEELALAHHCGVASAICRAMTTRGLVEEGDAGMQFLQEAPLVLDGLPPTMERAHALVELGAALRRSGQRSAAGVCLREGHELAESFGARPLAERARIELEAAGARPRKPLRTGLEALTASERRITGLAASGLSNAEIAQALFVTLRTVEMHLSNAFRKLDLSSRTQLVDALAAHSSATRQP
jgi:DNA-binding CsgD family transcriptional regulator